MNTFKIVKDDHGRLCLLGAPTEVTADWLAIQTKPFAEAADLHTAYPISGGAVVVDSNACEFVRTETEDDVKAAIGTGQYTRGFNPAEKTIRELAYS